METSDKKRSYRVTTEPILFSFVLCITLSDPVITNLLMRQTCWIQEGVTPEKCKGDKLTAAQTTTSYLEIGKIIIETLIPAFISLFLGAWSDANGRRKLLMYPLIGHSATYCLWAGFSLITDLHPGYFLICSIPIGLTGGMISLVISTFCYLADVIGAGPKAIRMGIMEAGLNLGQVLGGLISPYILNSMQNGYWAVFTVSTAILMLNFLYAYFYLPETVQTENKTKTKLFCLDNLKDSFKTVSKKRPRHGRTAIIFLIFSAACNLVIMYGEGAVKYLSTWHEFGWSNNQFAYFNTTFLLSTFIVSGAGLYIGSSIFHIPDIILLLISNSTRVLSSILMGLSKTPQMLYVSTLIGSLRSFSSPLIRSKLAKLVSTSDIGKTYGFLASVEAVVPQVAVPIYASLYAEIINTNPSGALTIFFVSAFLMILPSIGLITVIILRRKNRAQIASAEE